MKNIYFYITHNGEERQVALLPTRVQRCCSKQTAYDPYEENKVVVTGEDMVAAVFFSNSATVASIADRIRHNNEVTLKIEPGVIAIHLIAKSLKKSEELGGESVYQISETDGDDLLYKGLINSFENHPLIGIPGLLSE